MKDESTMMRESVWVDDRNITECQQCKKLFCGWKKGVFGWVWVCVGVCEMGGRGAAVKMSRV